MAPPKVYNCKAHNYSHQYMVCPDCGHQYCCRIYRTGCPRTSWHPNHAEIDQERGRRQRELEEARRHE